MANCKYLFVLLFLFYNHILFADDFEEKIKELEKTSSLVSTIELTTELVKQGDWNKQKSERVQNLLKSKNESTILGATFLLCKREEIKEIITNKPDIYKFTVSFTYHEYGKEVNKFAGSILKHIQREISTTDIDKVIQELNLNEVEQYTFVKALISECMIDGDECPYKSTKSICIPSVIIDTFVDGLDGNNGQIYFNLLKSIPENAEPQLEKGLIESSSRTMRQVYAYLLSRRTSYKPTEKYIEELVDALKADDIQNLDNAENAFYKLQKLGEKANPYLEKAIESKDWQQRVLSAAIICRVGYKKCEEKAIDILLEQLKDDEISHNASFAMVELKLIGDKAESAVKKILQTSQDPQQLAFCIILLNEMGKTMDVVGETQMIRIADWSRKGTDYERACCITAFIYLGKKGFDFLLQYKRRPNLSGEELKDFDSFIEDVFKKKTSQRWFDYDKKNKRNYSLDRMAK